MVSLLLSAAFFLPVAATPRDALLRLFEDYWQIELRRHPTRATYQGDHRYDDQLEDYSDAEHAAWLQERHQLKRALKHIPRAELTATDLLNAEIFDRRLTDEIEMAQYPGRRIPLGPQNGPHIDLAMLLLSHPFKAEKDYDNYVARLRKFPRQIAQVIAQMQLGIKEGVVPPRVIMGKVLDQCARHVVADPAASEFHKPVTTWADTIPAGRRADIARQVDAAIREAVVPAYKKLHDFLRDEYLPKCRDTVGLAALPKGTEWYARLAKYHTTTNKTPREIHEIGMKSLERIHADMDAIRAGLNCKGTRADFEKWLRSRADMHAKSATELMEKHAAILKRSDAQLHKLFGRLPKQRYELKEIEAFRAPEAPMAYYYEAPDVGDRPAYFYVNTYKPTERPLYTMEALAYHEAMPGHHLQGALAKEDKSLPNFRRHSYVTSYCEGWGLYSESLGKDLGGYQDPYSDYGRLTFDAWRSCRLVVDTGMHDMGWTRQQAIDFMKANTSMTELDIVAEVDRYIAWPGQALAYKIGQLAILDLRREAQKRLSIQFDIRAFHDALLAFGPLPLDLLKEHMERWMGRVGGADKSSWEKRPNPEENKRIQP